LLLVRDEIRHKRFDDATHKLRQLQERWDNRLIVEKLPLFKAYLDGRICVGLIVEMGGRAFWDGAAVRKDAKLVGREGSGIIIICERDPGPVIVSGKQDGAVLVEIVQLVECPKGKISSLVRLYCLDDEPAEVGSDLLFKSTIDRSFKFLPRFMHWEGDHSAGRVAAGRYYDFSDKMIECAPEVVDSVADDHSQTLNSVGSWLPKIEAEIAGFRLFIDERSVTFRRNETVNASLRVTDVLIGPFNL
jgi:hypothetical protein